MMTGAWADVVTTVKTSPQDVEGVLTYYLYTLENKTETGFYWAAPDGTLSGKSATSTTWFFENAGDGVYYVGDYASKKYLSYTEIGDDKTVTLGAEKSKWKIKDDGNSHIAICPESNMNYGLNCNGNQYMFSAGPNNGRSWWTMEELTPEPVGLKISIGETGYTTFCYNACYAKPADVKAYYCVESKNPDMLTLVEWDRDYLCMYMPYILKGSANTDYTFEKYNETTIPEENKEEDEAAKTANVLKGIAGDAGQNTEVIRILHQSAHIYVLSKVGGTMGFYNFGGSTLAAHKAFYAPKNTTKVNGFILNFGGLTEGVSTVMGATNLKAGFDIQGRRINKMQKGINILNGQKIIK